jgi:2-iminobutanoate/2-iminopropanoate deaminase
MRQLLSSSKLPAPKFLYTQCVRADRVFVMSGMVGLHPMTGRLVEGGQREETQRIFENLALALEDFDLTLNDLLVARIYTTRLDAFDDINQAWNAAFAEIRPPARTSVGVVALPVGASVEIEFSFYKPNSHE